MVPFKQKIFPPAVSSGNSSWDYMMKKSGWTLVELLIIIATVGILSIAVSNLLLYIWRFYRISFVQKNLQEEARTIMELITRNLRNGKHTSITIGRLDSTQPPYSKIDLTTIDGHRVSYYQKNRSLYENVDGNLKVISKNITYFVAIFPRFDEMNIVSIALTLEQDLYELKTKALHVASEKVMVMNE
jgi:type II secretory pathway pseudopilin PulG